MQVDNGLTLENEINHYTKVFAEMLDVMEFSLEIQENGEYFLKDNQDGYLGGIDSYRNFTNADEIIDRLGTFFDDYYYRDLEEAACEEFGLNASELPYSAEEWVQLLEKDEYENFKKSYFHEYEVMKLISSPEILESIKLDDVVEQFYPNINYEKDDKIVIARPVSPNKFEYVCGDDGTTLQFADENEAKAYLLDKGYTEQLIEDEGIIFKTKSLLENLLDVAYSQKDIALSEQHESDSDYYSIEEVKDIIKEMGSNEHITLDEYMENVAVVITKDPDYDNYKNTVVMDMEGKDVMNLVTVDFKLNGKSIASTMDIHIDDLEKALNDILKGEGNYLIDEKRTLKEIVDDCNKKAVKKKEGSER